MGAPGHGERNLLATKARLIADVRLLMDVSRAEFVPMPIVDVLLPRRDPPQANPAQGVRHRRRPRRVARVHTRVHRTAQAPAAASAAAQEEEEEEDTRRPLQAGRDGHRAAKASPRTRRRRQ